MNQTDLLQNIIATERQANALTESARSQQENMETSIQEEIDALRLRYEKNAEAYLQRLEQSEQEKSAVRLKELDERLAQKLRQVEDSYQAHRDEWIQAIFERITGKAGS